MDELDCTGRTVLVVGGSSGIGNGIAQAYRARGATVHVWGTRPTAADYDGEDGSDLTGLEYRSVDVSNFDAVDALDPGFDTLDVLIQCQGVVEYGRREFERDVWDRVMDVNINSVMVIAMKFRHLLSKASGSMVIVSSVAGFIAARGTPAYSASKTAAVGLVRTLGEAFADEGVRVNGIAPGYVATKMTAYMHEDPRRQEMALQSIPLRRAGTPQDMAGAAMFLTSELAAYITGQTLIVDGGLTLS